MSEIDRANAVARDEGGIYRVESLHPGQAKIVWAEPGANEGATYWQGPVTDVVTEVRRASVTTRVLRHEAQHGAPELPESY